MEQKVDLKLKILIRIQELGENLIDVSVVDEVVKYNRDLAIKILLELIEEHYITAKPVTDESNDIIYIKNIKLLSEGEGYIKKHTRK